MNKILSIGAILACVAPQLAVGQAAREAVVAAETGFAAAAAKNGTPAAFIAHSTPTSMVGENGRLVSAQTLWRTRTHQPKTQLSWRPVMADASQSGELGYTTGPWSFTKNGQAMASGDYVTVWHKQADGQWKFDIDMGVEHGLETKEPGADVARPQLFGAGATPVAVPSNTIMSIDQKFTVAEQTGPAKAYKDFLSTEGRLLRPGQQPLVGAAARTAAGTLSRAYQFAANGGYMAASGDLGYVYGIMRRPARNSKETEENGTFLRIWRREAVAGWRIVVEVINVITPVTTPAAATTESQAAPAGQ